MASGNTRYLHGQAFEYNHNEPNPHLFPTPEDIPELEIPYIDASHALESLVVRSPETTPKTLYVVPHVEFDRTRRTTHSLAKLIGHLPIVFSLPKQRATR
jgi:hypothetical protein